MGYRSQGWGDGEKPKLRRIEAPESMKNIKKITHGKFFRMVLTEEGKVFMNGWCRRYMLGSNSNSSDHVDHFHNVDDTNSSNNQNNWFRLPEGEKITDIAGGKNFMIVATQNGRVWASSYMFYRYFSSCRENPERNEDYPFELKMPEGQKAR